MKSLEKLNKLADRFESKLRKTAQTFDSSEQGVHATILFGDNPGAKAKQFLTNIKNVMTKLLIDYATKNNTGLTVKVYPDISVGSTPDSGKIVSKAEVTVTNDPDGKKTVALTTALQNKLDEIYKGVSGKNFAGRAAELNNGKKFPLNANKVSPELSWGASLDAPSEE